MVLEIQNKTWAQLPIEFRNEIRRLYKHGKKHRKRGRIAIYESLFGKHNILSESEPEELLIVKRYDIILNQNNNDYKARKTAYTDEYGKGFWEGENIIAKTTLW